MNERKIHRVQREIYNRVLFPLVKMEQYPTQDLRLSQPIIGRMVPGYRDPAISAHREVWSRITRKPTKYSRLRQVDEPEIPGVPGSGRHGKEVRDKMEKDKNDKIHRMGDSNTDPSAIAKLQQMVGGNGGGGSQPGVQQQTAQTVSAIPDQMGWR